MAKYLFHICSELALLTISRGPTLENKLLNGILAFVLSLLWVIVKMVCLERLIVMNRKIYLGMMLVLSGIFFPGCASIEQALNLKMPTASLIGFKIDEITLDSATLLFDVEVDNPYPVTLPLTNLDYNLVSNARPLFSGSVGVQNSISANSATTVALPVSIKYMDILMAFKGIKPGTDIPYEAKVNLSVDAPALGLIQLPLNRSGELSVPNIAALNEVDWKQMLLDKAKNIGQ